jgi:hypothetical protein
MPGGFFDRLEAGVHSQISASGAKAWLAKPLDVRYNDHVVISVER